MQRHRNNPNPNPSNGFRSNPVSGGPVYRNYNRGYGRAHQQPPPRRIDVFYEAGKLAADYLLAKGVLPSNNNSSNNKWQNNYVSDSVSGSASGRRLSDGAKEDPRVRRTIEPVKSPVIELNCDIRNQEIVKGEDEAVSGLGKDEERKTVLEEFESKSLEPMIVEEQKEVMEENVVVKTDQAGDEAEVETEVKNVDVDMVKDHVNVTMDDKEEGDETRVKEEVRDEDEDEDENEDEDEDEDENKNKSDDVDGGSSDLLTLIRTNKVPTRTRSSVTLKGSKSGPVLICGDENKAKNESSEEVEVKSEQGLNNEPKKMKPVASDEDDMYKFGLGLHMRSQSFPQRSISELEINEGIHGYSRCSSEILRRGEKRPMEINDNMEITKKQKDWVLGNPQLDNYFNLSGSRGDQLSSQEKQLFSNSFKICDLNLMGVSEANENHDTSSSVIGFSSIGQAKQEPVSVGFDLTMNNSCGIGDRHIRRGADGKGVEVIDLDIDVQDDNNNSYRRDEAMFTDVESFPDSMQRVNNMPEDGYGLMISELLDADIPNSSVSTGVNSMHNVMNLQNEEEILGDDESIYMSLGEIPISFVPVWDQQPSQGYDKRY